MPIALALTGFFASTTSAIAAGGTTHNVRVNGDIQAAITGASNGDTIQLAAGQYDITTTIDPGGKQVTILGTVDGDGDPTSILDGGNPVGGTSGVRVLICQTGETGTTVFQNLVIQNGYASVGGWIYNNASSPTLTNCTFTSNSTNDGGGGMFNVGSNPTLTNCTFTGNWANGGGGMANVGSSPTLEGCMFSGNSARGTGKNAGIGGGMVNLDSAPRLTDCTLTGNSADLNGGAIFNIDMNTNTVTLTDCNFCGNNDGSGFNDISGGGIDDSSSGNNLREAACVFGDINFDGVANLADRTSLNTLIGVCDADINGDGEVSGADLAFILSWWGVCSP